MDRTISKIMIHINSLGKGGAERVVSLLSGKFAEDGIQVVIATEWVEKEEYPISDQVKRIHVGLSEKQEQSSRLSKQWYRIDHLRKAIKEEKPDLLLSFCVKANYRAMMASTGMKIPVVVSVRNDPKIDYVGKKNELMNKLFLNKAAGCVFQTEEAQEFFDEVLQQKSTIICNPVNEKFLKAERKTPEKKIVCVGRLVKQKNQMLLVNAFEQLLKKYPDYQLYLYGDGSDDECKDILVNYVNKTEIVTVDTNNRASRQNYEMDTIEHGNSILLKDTVHFMGLSDTLEKDMADAAMFVLPSNYEGMPNALMEAMALGLPVISTDCPCGGSRYWISHGENGSLVPVGEVEALADTMCRIIEDPEKAEEMGQKARERLQDAALHKVYAEWKKYLEHVMMHSRQ